MQQFPSTSLVQKYVITAEAVERKRKKHGSSRTLPNELIADILNAFIRADGDHDTTRGILGISIRSKENIRMLDAIGHWGPKLLPTPLRKLVRQRRIGHHKKSKIRRAQRPAAVLPAPIPALEAAEFPTQFERQVIDRLTSFVNAALITHGKRLTSLEDKIASVLFTVANWPLPKKSRPTKPFILKRILRGIGRRFRFLVTGR